MSGSDRISVVAKYGADAAFANGKPVPPVAARAVGEMPTAKPPIIRKKGTAA